MAVAAEVRDEPSPSAPIGEFEEADRHLKKRLGFTSLLFMSMGAIIGSGWLFATLKAAGTAGPAAVVSWVVGGVFIIFIALAWAEVSAMLPRTGGIVRYPQMTHGAFTGWNVGWAYWLSAVSVPTIEAEATVTYLGGRFPQAGFETPAGILLWPNGILFGIGLLLFFFALNYFGIRLLGEFNKYITWWKIVIPVLTFCFLFAAFKGRNFTGYHGFTSTGFAPIFSALSTSGIIFAFLGFRQALDYGGESRRPQRDIPLATILSVVIAMVIYVGLQIGLVGALNWGNAKVAPGNWAGLLSSPWKSGPLYNALGAAGIGALGAFATVLLFDAGISPSGTGWIYLGTSTRTNYGLSIGRFLPKPLQWHNRFGIPWVSLIAAFVVGCVFFVPAPSWYELVGFITSATVLTYVMGGLSQPVLRKTAPSLFRPFRLRHHQFWAPVGFLAAMMIVYWSGFTTLANVFAAVFVGLPLFAWFYARNKGWVNPIAAGALGLLFLGAWIYVNKMGGWVLSANGAQVPGSWGFPTYDIAFSAAVIAFCVALWGMSNAEGKMHIERSAWFFFMVLATFPLSYWGEFGPLKTPALGGFPYSTLIEVGIGLIAYYWGVRSGFETDEIREIVSRQPGAPGEAIPLVGRAGTRPTMASSR